MLNARSASAPQPAAGHRTTSRTASPCADARAARARRARSPRLNAPTSSGDTSWKPPIRSTQPASSSTASSRPTRSPGPRAASSSSAYPVGGRIRARRCRAPVGVDEPASECDVGGTTSPQTGMLSKPSWVSSRVSMIVSLPSPTRSDMAVYFDTPRPVQHVLAHDGGVVDVVARGSRPPGGSPARPRGARPARRGPSAGAPRRSKVGVVGQP